MTALADEPLAGRAATGPAAAPSTVVVLAKAPEPGKVKTRLCPPATPAQAADLAAAALLDTLDAVRAVPGGRVVVALSGHRRAAARATAVAGALAGVAVVPQRGTDLGHRIAAAHLDAVALRPGTPVVLVGMDTPQLRPELLVEAAEHLRGDADAVLGPAADGGWWVLGLRDPRRAALVRAVPTSRADTGERTLRVLRGAGLRVALLAELRDVDTAADAVAVAAEAPGTRFAAAVAGVAALHAARPW
ncbi:TIGR04282 family arsenosugar biosynthesis glycosyltransferase [Pseudonocardia humida]|uniref:TIGR04282 family arsenosugar biosynthesis glycosyltransferase n=1 Tax=Pseudonocardia humida TaxID=2800819 RepID=A0ABT1ADA9_9PSEU|nr:TIGR04282 family arsenosugar biosynthesis glycosyltransferase [Pseudonocardia humida]MCO1660574.1 TIGR04282 family arsenosugar biosynthesis glycosyltransferase [Pseudonocardia humida]